MTQSHLYSFTNTLMMTITIAIFIVTILLLLSHRRGYNRLLFIFYARSLKLSKKHLSILESLIKTYQPSQPYEVFKNGPVFNGLLRQAFQDIDKGSLSEEAKTNFRFTYYKLKHLMEVKNSPSQTIDTTKNLAREGTILVSTLDNLDWFFKGTIKGQRGNNFIVKLDQPKFNEPNIKSKHTMVWTTGLKLKAIYLDRQHTEYLFKTVVLSIASNSKEPALLCAYSSDLTKVRRRNHRRYQTEMSATVAVIYHNNGQVKIDAKEPCLVTNISLGGCALTTRKKIEHLSTVCLEFTIANEDVTYYGKVISCERQGLELSVRIKFTRATKASLNAISALVYNF